MALVKPGEQFEVREANGGLLFNGAGRMNGSSANASEVTLTRIVTLRLAVGLLGERDNAGWWRRVSCPRQAPRSLPRFSGRRSCKPGTKGSLSRRDGCMTSTLASGASSILSACPEVMEQRLFDAVQSAGRRIDRHLSSPDAARRRLSGSRSKAVEAKSGPAL